MSVRSTNGLMNTTFAAELSGDMDYQPGGL